MKADAANRRRDDEPDDYSADAPELIEEMTIESLDDRQYGSSRHVWISPNRS